MNVLALCGSLRAASVNRAVLQLAAGLAPRGMRVRLCHAHALLPLFNPDLEAAPPDSVHQFRAEVEGADALLIASPEYAHGVSGVIKNTLDWMVSMPALVDVPVAVLNAAPRASHADGALRETLATMSLRIVEGASLALPVSSKIALDTDPAVVAALRQALAALHLAPRRSRLT